MLDKVGTITQDVKPSLQIMGAMSVRALDSLPLPVLLVLFALCLVLLQLPSHASPLLPVHSPSDLYPEKARLSPLPPTSSSSLSQPDPSQSLFTFAPLPPYPSYRDCEATVTVTTGNDAAASATCHRGRGRGQSRGWSVLGGNGVGRRGSAGRVLDVLEELDEKREFEFEGVV